MINGDRHHTFVIEHCGSTQELRRKTLKWTRIHGPNTRIYVDEALKHVHLCWELMEPEGLLRAEKYLAKKSP